MGIRDVTYYGWADRAEYWKSDIVTGSISYLHEGRDGYYYAIVGPDGSGGGNVLLKMNPNDFSLKEINSPPPLPGENLGQLYAVSQNENGLFVATGGGNFQSGYGGLYRSRDEGLNWEEVIVDYVNTSNNFYVSDVICMETQNFPFDVPDPLPLYALVWWAGAGSDEYVAVFSSSDGGDTWFSASSVQQRSLGDATLVAGTLAYGGGTTNYPTVYASWEDVQSNFDSYWNILEAQGSIGDTIPGRTTWSTIYDVYHGNREGENVELGRNLVCDADAELIFFGGKSTASSIAYTVIFSTNQGFTFQSTDFPFINPPFGPGFYSILGDTSIGINPVKGSISPPEPYEVWLAGASGSRDLGQSSLRWQTYKCEAISAGDSSVTFNRITSEAWDDLSYPASMIVTPKEEILIGGTRYGARATIRAGKAAANSQSLGPSMINTSFGYVLEELSGSVVERFKLNNVSEFSHAGGAFQMPNIILGTIDSGQVGNDDDSIIQVSHLGSVVHIMWPNQTKDADTFVQGFGSFSSGQKAGKLTTEWITGSFFDVTEFDHLTLYGYLTKAISGTLDNVDMRVERRPLRDAPFAVDQAVEYTTSGSEAIATYRDLIHTKEIDYGNLSTFEIGWPIDIPLTNVKELRISARHRLGQTEDKNKNLIVWGRLIKSEEET
jgi:hypothetical protein